MKIKDSAAGLSGGFVALLFVVLVFSFDIHPPLPYSAMFYGAVFEEFVKVVIAFGLYRFGVGPLGLGLIGLGFGVSEQLYHFTFPYGDASLITMWMHALTGIGIGYFFNWYDKIKRSRYIFYAYLSAFIVHGSFNAYLYYLLFQITNNL